MNTAPSLAIVVLFALFNVGCATNSAGIVERPVYKIDCDNLDGLVSNSGGEKFVLEFVNTRNSTLNIYWINYEGIEELKGLVSSGKTWSQNTYISHPWVVRDSSGLCISAYQSTSSALVQIE